MIGYVSYLTYHAYYRSKCALAKADLPLGTPIAAVCGKIRVYNHGAAKLQCHGLVPLHQICGACSPETQSPLGPNFFDPWLNVVGLMLMAGPCFDVSWSMFPFFDVRWMGAHGAKTWKPTKLWGTARLPRLLVPT